MGPHWWSQPPLLEDPLQLQKPETPKFCAHSEQHLRPLWVGIWEFPQKEGTIPGRGNFGFPTGSSMVAKFCLVASRHLSFSPFKEQTIV